MAAKEKLGSVRRFGSRYGRTVRLKVAKIEKLQRAKHKCPFCRNVKVRRVTTGIWLCGKCNAKFTGRAYEPTAVRKTKGKAPLEPSPAPETKQDDADDTSEEPLQVNATDEAPEHEPLHDDSTLEPVEQETKQDDATLEPAEPKEAAE